MVATETKQYTVKAKAYGIGETFAHAVQDARNMALTETRQYLVEAVSVDVSEFGWQQEVEMIDVPWKNEQTRESYIVWGSFKITYTHIELV